VRITESIGRTSSTQSFSFIVAPFPAELVGNYAALIERNAEVNGGLGGYLSIRVSPSGILSGRLYTAAASYPVRERFKVVPDEDPVCDVTGGPVVLSMSLSRTTAELNGVAKVNQAEAALSGRRQMFFVVGRRDGRGIPLNISLQPAAPALGDPGQPQGNGWMRWTYARSGRVSGSGRLSDGSQLTVGGIAGADSKVRFRSVLHRGKGSILGAPILAQPKDAIRPDRADLMLTGNADWRKLAHQDDQDLSYPTINEALTLMGARHQLSSGLTLLGNADLANNARIEFTDGGLADAAQGAQVSQVFQLTTLNRAIFGNASANPCGVMVKFDTGNGTFSGSFRLNDAGGRRDVTFQGITVNQTGYGYFNLPPLPAQTIRTILSGGVTIRGQAPPGSP
jgi:hypothetical protein